MSSFEKTAGDVPLVKAIKTNIEFWMLSATTMFLSGFVTTRWCHMVASPCLIQTLTPGSPSKFLMAAFLPRKKGDSENLSGAAVC